MRLATIILFFVFVTGNLAAQLFTAYGYPESLDSLVRANFAGAGVQISNVQFKGYYSGPATPIRDIGFFNGQNTSLGIDSGLVLTGGLLAPPYGLGVPAHITANFSKFSSGDSLLDALIAPSWTIGAAVLEFDFVPNGDTVKFNYVFASDEYPHQVCHPDNDVFAFHISGPGIVGLQNIALVPNTSIPVGNNSINDTSLCLNPPNTANCQSVAYAQYYVDHTGDTAFIFNGSTTVLTAIAPTIPCQTYRLRLAIGEGGGSPSENSAVFLAANSFNSEPIKITPSVSYGGPDTLLYEGCGHATLVIRRTYDLQQAKTYTVAYGGTATYGVDYNAPPLAITMQPGQMYDTIFIYPAADMIADDGETLTVSIGDTLCNGDYFLSDVTLVINEKQGLTVNITPPGGSFCDTVVFLSTLSGAIPPLQYDWNNGQSADTSLAFFAPGQQTVTLHVSDACGQSAQASVTAHFGFYPLADFDHAPDPADLLSVPVYFYDRSSPDVVQWLWNFGNGQTSSLQNPAHYYAEPDTYMVALVVTTDIGCADSIAKPLVMHDIAALYMPNSFTPNGDQVNDVFEVKGREIADFTMTIFDRWGNLVYRTKNMQMGWDGQYNGQPCKAGVYAVRVDYSFNPAPEEMHSISGKVLLVR